METHEPGTAGRPLVSAIVPVYNGERYLGAALDSIFAQDYRPLEVIVVDDGSTDGSAVIARSYPGVTYIYQPNRGVAAARNSAIAAAGGEFVAFLDQDDTWMPGKLTLQVDYLLRRGELGYVLARQQPFLEPGVDWPPWLRKNPESSDYLGWMPGTLVARRSLFEQIGPFDTSFRINSDGEWLVRAADAGVRGEALPEVLLRYRVHDANESYAWQVGRAEFFKVLRASVGRRRSSVSASDARPSQD